MKCIVRECPRPAHGGELCDECRRYLSYDVLMAHPVLIRKRSELLPRLETVYRALTLPASTLMNKAAVGTLRRMIAEIGGSRERV